MKTPEKSPSDRSPFLVGIDLGTTNCAAAYVDMRGASPAQPVTLALPQWEAQGAVVESEMLPSFYWLPEKSEWKRGQLRLPWQPEAGEPPAFAVGRFARAQAALAPGRVIHSAKSWLCHAGVAREERILPWHSDDVIGDERRSPVEASAAYLAHIREAWNARMAETNPAHRLEEQRVVITVPASFDEVAQQLTLKAAELAGFPRANVRLLEEPQAAFYHWLSRHPDEAAQAKGHVLIVDVGGGTTDFSLFEVEPGRAPVRVAVSDHLLLGGDNIDLALAHVLERRLVGTARRVSSRQWAQLVFEARKLKERALAADAPADEELFVSIAGEGSSLFASSLTASVRTQEIIDLVTQGFLPACAREARPDTLRSGLRELGLPFAKDGAITRHMAAFLEGRDVDAVLYTGGTLKPAFMREALTRQIAEWQGRAPTVLVNDAMDLAVALGAAWSGATTRSSAIIAAYPRSLYLEVARPEGAALLCLVPKGLEPGRTLTIAPPGLKAAIGQPVRFQLFSSLHRDGDHAGDVIAFSAAQGLAPLPSIQSRLDAGPTPPGAKPLSGLVPVALEAHVTETGLLELHCVPVGEDPRRWRLSFNVRAEQSTDAEDAAPSALVSRRIPADLLAPAQAKVEALYGKKKRPDAGPENPKGLVRELEELFDLPRDAWDSAFLRSLWPTLEQGLTRRGRSVAHEAAWLYLAGFSLRPGYGVDLDEWRVSELWRAYQSGPAFPAERQIEEQWWIMWRRVAGGLTRDQQEKIFDKIFPSIRKAEVPSAEVYMLAGSLEHLEMGRKLKLGNQLVQQIVQGPKAFMDQKIWALARIASRVPLYAGPAAIVRPKQIAEWHTQLRYLDPRDKLYAKLNLFYSQAGRIVKDREFDLPDDLREAFVQRLETVNAKPELVRVVKEFVPVDTETRSSLFGDSLPAGLRLG